MYSYGPPHMAVQKQDDQLELTYSNYVRTQDVTLKTCQRRWMIGRSGKRGSGISVLAARHDDDDFYSIIIICLYKVIWLSVCLSNTNKLQAIKCFQITHKRVTPWCSSSHAGLWHHSKQVQTLFVLLCSLSD